MFELFGGDVHAGDVRCVRRVDRQQAPVANADVECALVTFAGECLFEQLEQATQAARKLDIPFDTHLCQEASRIELDDASFDLIICSRVLQHVFNWRESVAEFARILKPGGDLVLLTYNRLSIYGLKKYHQHLFVNPTKGRFQNPVGLARELKKHGLRIDYFAGGLMGQPDLFSKDLSDSSRRFINSLEKLSHVTPIKYLGSRLIIRAHKPR